ncbi:hypothetical protein diail_3439 [Diaporthe ilicicola]|nr:hypothetical protein diail_3439 [Diaporthe ilicicola]
MSCIENPSVAGSPARVNNKVIKHATPPRRSSKRIFQTVTTDFSRSSPRRSADGLVRPLPKFRSSNLLCRDTRRIAQSPLLSPANPSAHRRGKDTFRKDENYVDKTNSPLASVLAVSDDLNGSVADSKMSRLRKNKVFAKFASALSEHFIKQGVRQEEKADKGASEMQSVASDGAIEPIMRWLPLGRLALNQLPLPEIEVSSTCTAHLANETGSSEEQKGNGSVKKVRAGLSMPQKRLTMVEGSPPLEDPFSEESPRQPSTEFEARLKTIQSSGVSSQHIPVTPSADPFMTEGIMDTSDNSILKTPPIGCSTPRVQGQSLIPTKVTRLPPDDAAHVCMVYPDGPPTSPSKRRKVAVICDSPTKPNTFTKSDRRKIGSGSPSKTQGSSDVTRLSSFPPGSTIRHVPRSMGRLTEVPDLSMSAAADQKSPETRRKKHPSPSKGDLDLYGKIMEEKASLGVFKDTDELGMSLTSPLATNSPALIPRDKNSLFRGLTGSHPNMRRDYKSKDSASSLTTKCRSRIPQPVSQHARSRAETAYARDLYPAGHGDSAAEDELQWNSSTYIVGLGRGNRCGRCGSTSEAL